MLRHGRLALLAFGLWIATVPASASLVGSVISGAYYFGTSSTLYWSYDFSPAAFTAGDDTDSVLTVDSVVTTLVDFAANSLILTATSEAEYGYADFNGPQFTLVSGEGFGAVLSVIASGGQTVTAAIVDGVLRVNWAGQNFSANDTITITFGATEIPEPATLALLGAGLLGFQAARRRGRGRADTNGPVP